MVSYVIPSLWWHEACPRCDLPPSCLALCCCHYGTLACTPLGETFRHQEGCPTTNKEDGFQAFNFYSYILFGVGQPRPQGAFPWLSKVGCVWRRGGGGAKNYQEIRRGAELILLLRKGWGALHDNFAFEAHSSAPSWYLLHSSLPGSDCVVFFALIGLQRSWPYWMNRAFYYLYIK